MKIRWPRLTFPPINLWNAPRQLAWEDRMTMDNDQPSWQELKDERDALSREVDALDKAIRRQANAAKRGMNAAKEYGAHMEAEAKRLHAECNPEALESERQANAQLTEENAALAAQVERLREAITPFAAGGAADCISRGDYSVMRERLKDWLGVKDFEMAAEALRETPTTSLARRDAVTRRDEVESLLSVIGAYPDRAAVFSMLRERSEELHRQAEGGE